MIEATHGLVIKVVFLSVSATLCDFSHIGRGMAAQRSGA
jgi:hypothetical protein